MNGELDSTTDPAILRKRRLGLLALMVCGIATLTGLGIAGRFDFSIGLDNKWAGPVRVAVNGAVGDGAAAGHGGNAGALQPSQPLQPGKLPRVPTPAELEAYDAAQRELASALQDRYRSIAAQIEGATTDSDVASAGEDAESRPYQTATDVMNETSAKLRQ